MIMMPGVGEGGGNGAWAGRVDLTTWTADRHKISIFFAARRGERLCFCYSHPTTPLSIELRLRGHINALGLIQVARRIIILFSAQTNGEMDGPDFSIRS